MNSPSPTRRWAIGQVGQAELPFCWLICCNVATELTTCTKTATIMFMTSRRRPKDMAGREKNWIPPEQNSKDAPRFSNLGVGSMFGYLVLVKRTPRAAGNRIRMRTAVELRSAGCSRTWINGVQSPTLRFGLEGFPRL